VTERSGSLVEQGLLHSVTTYIVGADADDDVIAKLKFPSKEPLQPKCLDAAKSIGVSQKRTEDQSSKQKARPNQVGSYSQFQSTIPDKCPIHINSMV
jgi:hypothetical protein